MAVTWLTPINVTPGVTGSFQDVDNASVPDGASGVILHVENTHLTTDQQFGARKNGSGDARNAAIHEDSHTWLGVGVDATGIFEVYVGTADIVVWLVGYFGSEASFFTNAPDKSTATITPTWEDVDISGDTGGDTAIGAFFEIHSGAQANESIGLRKNGSTDDRFIRTRRKGYALVGVDGSELAEQRISTTAMDLFLMGYLKSEATLNTNANDRSLGSTGAWLDLGALPSGASGGIYEIDNTATDGDLYGLRKDGSSENILHDGMLGRGLGLVESASLIVEGQISSLSDDFFEMGYFHAAAAPGGTWPGYYGSSRGWF